MNATQIDGNVVARLGCGQRFRAGWLCAAILLTVLTPARSVTIRHDRSPDEYIGLAQAPDHSSVGLFVNSWGRTGSATLIAPDWILTAAHMLTAASAGTFTINGTSYGSAALHGHPAWNGNAFAGYDFALVRLSATVVGVAPAALYAGNAESSLTGVFVGYGLTGTGLTGYQPPPDDVKRAFENVIDGDFGNPSILLGSDFDNPLSAADNDFGSPVPLTLEGAAANGDSGGGVFINVGNVTYLAGVMSFVAGRDGLGNGDYGDVTGFGRVSAVLPWINSTIGVPEPSSGALFAAGLIAILAKKRSSASTPTPPGARG